MLLFCLRRPTLVAPYRAIPQDYLSDTPYCALWGFWCLNMANWVGYPLPLFWPSPPLRACEVEVRYPPPSKGVSQRYLRDALWKQGKWVRYPPSAILSQQGIARYGGGISHWAAKRPTPPWGLFWAQNVRVFDQSAPKERRRRRAEKRSSKRVFLESPFLLCKAALLLKHLKIFQQDTKEYQN